MSVRPFVAPRRQADGAEIQRSLGVLLESGTVAELRVLHTPRGTVSGYFDDLPALAEAATTWSGQAPGVYVTANPVTPTLLARATNRVKPYAKHTTNDADIVRRRRLLLDFDAAPAAGISTTEDEHQAALDRARACVAWLRTLGFTDDMLLLADSGNGAHIVVGIDLPNDDASRVLVERCLAAVAFRFTDDAVRVDVTVGNAARIWKLYGTLAAKGDHTPERPHRLARILAAPMRLAVAPRPLLEHLAAMAPPTAPKPSTTGPRPAAFDLATWIGTHANELHVVRQGPWNGGQRYILNPCPWNPEHTNEAAFLVQFPSGAIAAGCHHNGCAGRDWHALRDAVEPGWRTATGPTGSKESSRTGDGDGKTRARFRFLSDEEVASLPAPDCLVDGMLEVQSLAILWGAPGTAKTFLALDVALAVASGLPCLGRTVRQGPVAYIAAEGVAGLGVRVRAWKQAHGVQGAVGVAFLTEAVNLLDQAAVAALVAALVAFPAPPVLVVVDTFARCLVGGDENSAKDVGLAIAALDRLRTEVRCTVFPVHHSGKNADTERGSSALRGAADTMLALTKDGDAIVLRCDKSKNTAPFDERQLKLVVVDLEEMESSCVLEPGAPPVTALTGSRLSVLRTLIELFDTEGATFTELVKSNIPESTLRRALVDLVAAGYVAKPPKSRGGKYTATESGTDAFRPFTARRRGGDFSSTARADTGNSQSPPRDRHGGDHKSPPPPPPPYRGGGEAVSGGDGEWEEETL